MGGGVVCTRQANTAVPTATAVNAMRVIASVAYKPPLPGATGVAPGAFAGGGTGLLDGSASAPGGSIGALRGAISGESVEGGSIGGGVEGVTDGGSAMPQHSSLAWLARGAMFVQFAVGTPLIFSALK